MIKKGRSKDKQIRGGTDRRLKAKQKTKIPKASPLYTLEILWRKNESLKETRLFQKHHIDKIINRRTLEAQKYKELQKVEWEGECLQQYYSFQNVKNVFTPLITQCSLKEDIVFLDFKAKHFKMMNHYHCQKKKIGKNKEENNRTASHSFIQEPHPEIGVRQLQGEQPSHNASLSLIEHLAKNIEKMIRNIKDENSPKKSIEIKETSHQESIMTPDISHIDNERVHTTPEPCPLDLYGLAQYCSGKPLPRSKPTETIYTHRCHTEYDTEIIPMKKKSKDKILVSRNKNRLQSKSKRQNLKCKLSTNSEWHKKSVSNHKVLSKGKSPLGLGKGGKGLRVGLKMKK